jgi:hypothetical protein
MEFFPSGDLIRKRKYSNRPLTRARSSFLAIVLSSDEQFQNDVERYLGAVKQLMKQAPQGVKHAMGDEVNGDYDTEDHGKRHDRKFERLFAGIRIGIERLISARSIVVLGKFHRGSLRMNERTL